MNNKELKNYLESRIKWYNDDSGEYSEQTIRKYKYVVRELYIILSLIEINDLEKILK